MRLKPIKVYGPTKIEDFVEKILALTSTPRQAFPFNIKYFEFNEKKTMKYDEISALHVIHSTETLAYRIDRKKNVCYTSDTGPCEKLVDFAKNADLLIHDVSGTEKQAEWAHKYHHCTSKDAALTARNANAKMLAMVHIMPQNEKDKDLMIQEAKKYFDGEILLPEDLTEINI